MRKLTYVLFTFICVIPLMAQEWKSPHSLDEEQQAPVVLLPYPKEVRWLEGSMPVTRRDDWKLVGEDGEMIRTAWRGLLSDLSAGKTGARVVCRLVTDSSQLPEEGRAEGYTLHVSKNEVEIHAAHEAGFFNALQTLRQLATNGKNLPCCEIKDWPAFAVRGFHEDCGRNFQTIESLKRQLDIASRLKVNYFHWHLTDHPGWHIQCKAYPQLNDPKYRTRDLNDTYSYKQIRELIKYARERNITIIPEVDMPGHSSYFVKAFGFPMHSEEGMKVLEELIREFCKEVPAKNCPIFHIGADEVSVPNAKEFVERMSNLLLSLGRSPMQWGGPRDLPVGEHSINQHWGDGGDMVDQSIKPESVKCRTIDSSMGYSNLFDPAMLVRRWFFMRPCGVGKGDDLRMGVLFCTWPDIRVADKSTIPLHSAQWPGLCAMAERAWEGGDANGDGLASDMPAPDTEAARAFKLFERRLAFLRKSLFKKEHFPYWTENAQKWTVIGPVPEAQKDEVRAKVLVGDYSGLDTRPAYGANLYFRTKPATGCLGMFSSTKPGACVWTVLEYDGADGGKKPFMIGFDAPVRSSRRYSGVPKAGDWSQCETRVWVNGKEFRNPQVYKLAGKSRYTSDTWFHPANEDPLTDEEVWWAHQPTMVPLKKGKNTIIIEQPYKGEFQSWGVSFIPVCE